MLIREGNETFKITVSNLVGAKFASDLTATTLDFVVTIVDNEMPILTINQNIRSVTEGDADKNIQIAFNMSGTLTEPVDISYALVGITATAGIDFSDNSNGSTTISANSTTSSISIQIKGDNANEGIETFKISVANPPENVVFAAGVSTLELIITINDDELPTLTVDNSTLTVSEAAVTSSIGVNLSGPATGNVVLTYLTSFNSSNTADENDITAQSSNTITIAAPATAGLIQIPITGDAVSEENETFTLTISRVTGAVFEFGQSITVTVTIIDDDREQLSVLSVNTLQNEVNEEAGFAEVDLRLNKDTNQLVRITYSTIQDTATEGLDFVKQTSTTTDIPNGMLGTIFIPVLNDNLYEGNEKFFVKITNVTGAAYNHSLLDTPITVTINDDDDASAPTITIGTYTCENSETILPISA